MPSFAQLKLKIKKAFGKCCFSSPNKRTPTRGFYPRGLECGPKPTRPCLSCQTVWVQFPFDLCRNCELSPYVPPFLPKEKEEEGKREVEEAPGGKRR